MEDTMLKKFFRNRKAQNTAEYALLIALVVAGVIAMQTYAQRALQARIRDAAHFMVTSNETNAIGNTQQYEPYYLASSYNIDRESSEIVTMNNKDSANKQVISNRARQSGGFQSSTYSTQGSDILNGI